MRKFISMFFVFSLLAMSFGVGSAQSAPTITVTVNWNNPSTGGNITAMHVQRSYDGINWTDVSPAFTGNIQTYTDTAAPLTAGVPSYRVNRCNVIGCAVSATYTPPVFPPDAATNINGAYTINP